MGMSELFLLVFAFVLFVYSTIKEDRERKNRGKDPATSAEEKRARKHDLQNFLKSLELDMQEDEEELDPRTVRKEKPKKVVALPKKSAISPKKISQFDQEALASGGEFELGTYSASEQEFHDPFGKIQGPVNLNRATEAGDYQVIGKTEASRISKLIERIPSKRQLVILQEIIGKPKGL